jgi:hypothetical protein
MSAANNAVLADIQSCVAQIAGVMAKLEDCVRALQEQTPASTSRIHRPEPPVIPPEIASGLSRASSRYEEIHRSGGGGRGSSGRNPDEESSVSRPSTVGASRAQPKFVDWASNLSGLSRASTGGGARPQPVEDAPDTY